MKSQMFTFKYTELNKTYLVEAEVLHLDNGNTRLGGYCVFDNNQQIILDVEEEVLENELIKFIGGKGYE